MAYFVYRDKNGNIQYGMDSKGWTGVTPGNSSTVTARTSGLSYNEGGWKSDTNDDYFNTMISEIDNVVDPKSYWHNLSKNEKRSLLKTNYKSEEIKDFYNLWGAKAGKNYTTDIDRLLSDLEELDTINSAFDTALPEASDYIDSSEDLYKYVDEALAQDYANAYARLDSDVARLNTEAEQARTSFEDQLKTYTDYYNRQASGLLSNQYLANAQTYDALQSDMRKARQNALEAGASAGIRLAGNVNALLSAQNKQSQTAMDTSNALAEMLLQQRNAAAGVRSDYRNYMSDINSRKTELDLNRTALDTQRRNERETRVADRRNAQQSDYNNAMSNYNNQLTNWENQWDKVSDTNPFKNPYQTYLRNENKINY